MTILNTGDATHYHQQTNNHSAIDLTLNAPFNPGELMWEVLDDTYGVITIP